MEQIPLPNLPFSVLAIASFSPARQPDDQPLSVDPLEIDEALSKLSPTLFISLPHEDCPAGGIELCFRKMQDFTPDGLLKSQAYLQDLLAADRFCHEAEQRQTAPDEIQAALKKWPALPVIVPAARKKSKKEETTGALDALLSMVDIPDTPKSVEKNPETKTYKTLACRILTAIYADPGFRTLESCWQGLRLLGRSLSAGNGQLSIVPGTAADLNEILENLRETVLRNPPSLLLLDTLFNSSEVSVQAMKRLADFGQEMLVPTTASVDAAFFQIDSWHELNTLSYLPNLLEGSAFARFTSFRNSDSGRWLSLSCIRFLLRFPYGADNRSRLLPFQEDSPLWITPVWALASLMAERSAQCGWAAGFAFPRPLLLEDLALDLEGSEEQKTLEILLNQSRAEQMADCGIIPIAGWKGKDTAFMAGDVMVSGDVSLSYQTLVCRVSHFLLWCRDAWQEGYQAEELEKRIRTAFLTFSENPEIGSAGELLVECHGEDQGIHLFFQWKPTPQILPDGQAVTLEFIW